jgi:hypothetical protein
MKTAMTKAGASVFFVFCLAAQTGGDGPQFTSDAQLALPKDYRQWTFLSSGLGMTYGPAASADPANPRFDNVFINPSSYRAFIETGHWPDKTMFILEIRSATGQGSINNAGHYQNELLAIEAEVKDEKRFPQKWAYFGFEGKDRAAALGSDSSCNSCHGRNAAVENTFVQFYPVLLEVAKAKGTLNPPFLRQTPAGHDAAPAAK